MTDNIPLTEFSSEEGLISPDFEHLSLRLPSRCLMAFLGEKRIAAFAEGRGGKIIGSFLSLTKKFPLYEIQGEKEPLRWLKGYFEKKGLPFHPATTWTSDGFFRETREKVEKRKAEGCELVDMETSALAACARFRKKEFAEIMFTADTLSSLSHDQRHWGKESRNAALVLGLEALEEIQGSTD